MFKVMIPRGPTSGISGTLDFLDLVCDVRKRHACCIIKEMKVLPLGFLLVVAFGIFALIIYITGVTNLYEIYRPSHEDLEALKFLQNSFQKCVHANGLGLQAIVGKDLREVSIEFPRDTDSKWKDPNTGELEGLSFDFNLCESVANWEQGS